MNKKEVHRALRHTFFFYLVGGQPKDIEKPTAVL